MKTIRALAAIVVVLGCGKAESPIARSDTTVASPSPSAPATSPSTTTTTPAKSCGLQGSKAVLEGGGIGALQVGKTVAAVKADCDVIGDAKEQGTEGMMERKLAVKLGGDVVSALISDDKVLRVEVGTPSIRTSDSLGVDTRLSRIASMRGAKFVPGEDGVYGFVADHCGLSFRFSVPLRPPKGRDWTVAAIDSAYGDAVVDRVLATKCQR